MCAVDLLKQLDHTIPPLSVETRSDMCLTTDSGSEVSSWTNELHARLVEPLSPPPPSRALGKIEFKHGSKSRGLAAAVFALGIPKYEKEVDINHLHVTWPCSCRNSREDSETTWNLFDWGIGFVLRVFEG